MNDEELIQLYWERNEAAITESAKKYHGLISSICASFLTDQEDIKECLNDILLKVWNAIPPTRPNSMSAYISKVSRNHAIGILRKNKAEKRIPQGCSSSFEELSELIPNNADVQGQFDVKELRMAVCEFLKMLPKDDRLIFVGRYFYMEDVRTVARKLGFSESKVRTSSCRTREKIKDYLSGKELL